jgi:hypothetical protein
MTLYLVAGRRTTTNMAIARACELQGLPTSVLPAKDARWRVEPHDCHSGRDLVMRCHSLWIFVLAEFFLLVPSLGSLSLLAVLGGLLASISIIDARHGIIPDWANGLPRNTVGRQDGLMGQGVHVQELPGIGKRYDIDLGNPRQRLSVVVRSGGPSSFVPVGFRWLRSGHQPTAPAGHGTSRAPG